MAGLRWRIDRSNLANREVRKAAAAGLSDAVEFLGDESDRTAPIEEGTMIRTRVSSVNHPQGGGTGKLRGAISYDMPYAARQHEEMTYRHDEGRRAKFLEQAMKEQGEASLQHIAAKVRQVLR